MIRKRHSVALQAGFAVSVLPVACAIPSRHVIHYVIRPGPGQPVHQHSLH